MQINLRSNSRSSKKGSLGSRIFITLFGIPFFGVGVFMLWLTGNLLYDGASMKKWDAVQTYLSSANLQSNHSSDNGTTYKVQAKYQYQYQGQWYMGDRTSISGEMSDNLGDFQEDLGRRLERDYKNNTPITIYVDPENPSNSIIDRSIRWGVVAFYMVFAIVFGGVGSACIWGGVFNPSKKRRPGDPSTHALDKSPWLAEKDWRTPVITSSAKVGMYVAWGFSIFWCAISSFLPFAIYEEVVEKDNTPALIGLIFPLIGLFLVYWAIKSTLQWKKIGPAPMTLDPFPGSIGGHVGGTVDINLPYDPNTQFVLTLTNVYTYVSGSGKNRSRNERPKWQKEIVAHSERGIKGTRITFRFDVPEGLTPSDADPDTSDYYFWKINVTAELDGADIDRDYRIPVYATAQTSAALSNMAVETLVSENTKRNEESAAAKIQTLNTRNGTELFYPAGRNKGGAFAWIIFALIFGGVATFLIKEEGLYFMGGIFGLVAGLILTFGIYSVVNSLRVWGAGGYIYSERKIFGITKSRKKLSKTLIKRIDKKKTSSTQKGNKHVLYYMIYAQGMSRHDRIVLGEGFQGANEANAALEYASDVLGIDYTPGQSPEPEDDLRERMKKKREQRDRR